MGDTSAKDRLTGKGLIHVKRVEIKGQMSPLSQVGFSDSQSNAMNLLPDFEILPGLRLHHHVLPLSIPVNPLHKLIAPNTPLLHENPSLLHLSLLGSPPDRSLERNTCG